MGKLGDIYSSIENPLENEEILKEIVEVYSKSTRTNMSGNDLYSSLVTMDQTKDSSQINLEDREAFMVEAYNQWIDSILSLDDAHIKSLEEKRGMDARQMQQYLRNFGKVSSMDDINRLKSNPLFNKEINGWELETPGWEHIKSQYISGRTGSRIPVKHRLYVGCQNQDMWKLAQLFKNKCEEQQVPFYFKLGLSNARADKMVIYADTDNLENYISILQEIAKEHPEIMQRSGKPPVLTGKIDGWIGIGDEPPKKENGENQSYNSLRADILDNAIEETLLNELKEFKGKDVVFNGKQIKFNDLFMEQAAQSLIEKLDKDKYELQKSGLRESDLKSDKLKEHIKLHLRKSIQKGINKLIDVKDQKSQIGKSNSKEIFAIPTKEGKSISVDTLDMDSIIKRMIPIMYKIDPQFMNKVKSKIQEKCSQNGIDDTFCFQLGTKERLEQVDLSQTTRNRQNENIQEQQTPKTVKKETLKQTEKVDRTKMTTEISSIDIVEILNPELLKKKIELPNGAKIPARQYIQEVVAPHIPSDGTFILNNGSQIPAKQYIEEFILCEGQEKYKGDISKLLSENTRSNNGTITVKGKQINAVDIVNILNPELMKRKVKLPNGSEIPATQYIQEIVAPHIPSDGNFILKRKSNGLDRSARISAQQFIEEAIMFEGQEKYNGDINVLLEAMTVANNGTVSIGTKTKVPRRQGLQQEIGISQAEAQKKETDEATRKQEERRKKDEKDMKKANEEAASQKKYRISQVKQSINRSQITSTEFEKSQHSMAEINEMRRLQFMGKNLTAEQQQKLAQLQKKYQTKETTNRHQRHNTGMGMSR